MSKIIHPGWKEELTNFINGVEEDLIVVTPFFSNRVLNDIIRTCKRYVNVRFLLGEISNISIANGSTDFEVLDKILDQRERMSCRCVKNLHAKVLVRDCRSGAPCAILTSSNLTEKGLHKNIEFGVLLDGNPVKELVEKLEYFWNNAVPLEKDDLKALQQESEKTNKAHNSPKISFGNYVPLSKQIIIDEDIRQFIESHTKNLVNYYKKRARSFKKARALLLRVIQNDLNLGDFEEILNLVQDETGAIGRPNFQYLLNNNIGRINKSLKVLLDERIPLEERINRLVFGEEKLMGGALGFVSSMLFIANSGEYNIYNQHIVEGLRKVFPEAKEAYDGQSYCDFNSLVMQVKTYFELRDEQIENVLWYLSRI